jgi:hypothetical protein
MKTALSLVLASVVLLADHAYAEKSAPQAHAKAAQTQRVAHPKPPVKTVAPKAATDAEIVKALNNGTQVRDQKHSEDISLDVKGSPRQSTGGNANASKVAPTNTPNGWQGLVENQDVKSPGTTQSAKPIQTRTTESSNITLQEKMQSENR